jgi:hypothetical protein
VVEVLVVGLLLKMEVAVAEELLVLVQVDKTLVVVAEEIMLLNLMEVQEDQELL